MSEINNNEEKNVYDNSDTTDNADVSIEISEDTEATPKKEESNKKKSKLWRDSIDYIEMFVFAVGFVVLLFSFCFRLCTVDGDSMNNTLFHGEKVVISDIFYSPEREDIIVFHDTNTLNEPVIKRVIATAGETVNISYGHNTMTVTVTDTSGNTFELNEDYIIYTYPTYLPNTYTVPEGMVFVMGDNRSNSKDSRNPDIGFVDEREILGRVLFRITPFSKLGTVK